jgi:hypothetical protein
MGSSRRIEKCPQSGWGCMGGGSTDQCLEGHIHPVQLYDAKIKNATNDKTKKQTNELCSNNVKPSNQQNNNNTINNTTTINNNNKIRVRVTVL